MRFLDARRGVYRGDADAREAEHGQQVRGQRGGHAREVGNVGLHIARGADVRRQCGGRVARVGLGARCVSLLGAVCGGALRVAG